MVHLLEELEKYAEENHVPIMQKDGIEFMIQYIKDHKCLSILEIGTAIGYSTIQMALVNPEIQVTTIERDDEKYALAVQNIKKAGLEKQIHTIHGDALEVEVEGKYDFIFIDAAKAQYIKFFEKYKKNLLSNGSILSDNLSFHGLVEEDEKSLTRGVRGLVRKLKNYVSYLKENKDFETTFYDIGDGISISVPKKKESLTR